MILLAAGVCLQACKENSMDVPEPKVTTDSFSTEKGGWTRLEDIPEEFPKFYDFYPDGYGFAIGDKGYLSGGLFRTADLKEYNITTRQFTRRSDMPVQGSESDFVAFSIGSMGYVGAGTAMAGGG